MYSGYRVNGRISDSMGVATTTDTTDSVRTSFEVFKNLYGMSVQVDETAKSKKDCKAAVWETFGKATQELYFMLNNNALFYFVVWKF